MANILTPCPYVNIDRTSMATEIEAISRGGVDSIRRSNSGLAGLGCFESPFTAAAPASVWPGRWSSHRTEGGGHSAASLLASYLAATRLIKRIDYAARTYARVHDIVEDQRRSVRASSPQRKR